MAKLYPFAEVGSDPVIAECFGPPSISMPSSGSLVGLQYQMTAAPAAPRGLVFKKWIMTFDGFTGPQAPCAEGNGSLTCTVTVPSNVTRGMLYPTLVYGPPYVFGGFLSPVDSNAVNGVNAGSSVPLTFSLGGNFGISILASNSPAFQPTNCSFTQTTAQATVTAGNSLSYDSTTNQYTYVWKTDKSWAGTCGEFVLALNDGSTHTANFQFF
jgi:hypothetical protein